MTTVHDLGEAALVGLIQRQLRCESTDIRVGMGDDGAILRVHGELVATVDSVVAGVDWLPDATPREAIGHRAAAVNLSDLAAMGARPAHLLLALELPPALAVAELMASLEGLRRLASCHGAAVVGGDVGIGAGPERWTLTALGHLGAGRALLRSAALPGWTLWLVGTVGAAAIGLQLLARGLDMDGGEETLRACVAAHLRPQPQCTAGLLLAGSGYDLAAIDISDGLWLDASRLAAASGVDLRLMLAEPPWLSAPVADFCATAGLDWRQACASGGDDYALLVAAPPEVDLRPLLAGRAPGDPAVGAVCRVGRVETASAEPTAYLTVGGRNFEGPPQGYLHGRGARGETPADRRPDGG